MDEYEDFVDDVFDEGDVEEVATVVESDRPLKRSRSTGGDGEVADDGADASQGDNVEWLSIDICAGEPLKKNPAPGRGVAGSKNAPVPVLLLYGVNDEGHSVLCRVHGFTPYFYFSAPSTMTRAHLPAVRAALENATRNKGSEAYRERVLAVELIEDHRNLMGYHFGRSHAFVKVYVAMPNLVPTAKSALERGIDIEGVGYRNYQCFEANMPFVLRFLIDRDIPGCCWLEAPANTYSIRSRVEKVSSCQLEIDIVYDSLVAHQPDGPWLRIAPYRILSFDIECAGRKGIFPEPEIDPVIQIANVVTLQGSSVPLVKNIFVLSTCSAIPGSAILSFEREGDLLEAWSRFVREVDPDLITGYNIANFDIPYLIKRAKALMVRNFTLLGRVKGKHSVMKNTTFQSQAFGRRENVETTVDGRVIMDMLEYMRRNQKLSSYSLNAVSALFLGQQKEDVHHSIITDLQNGSAEDRRRLAVYCLKDAVLPQRLMDKLMVIINAVEMSRVTGVPLDFLNTRGQQIKVVSMLYRKCRKEKLLIPTIVKRGAPGGGGAEDVGYEGATVIEPIKGYYDVPVATLDFASLYPSIMMAHNLCYSTLLAPEDAGKLPKEQVTTSPSRDHFVKASVHRGILPQILEELLAARKKAKLDMAAATDEATKNVQNGRQLAIKISANSVYGFTGATVGQLPCIPISSSVTAFGREMIEQTKAAVEAKYTVANGYPANAIVVYGDTDSVMVKFGVTDAATSMAMGKEAADEVSKLFPPPVKLEFEKIYFPFLLMNKKRYAGLLWTKPSKWDKMDAKGIETVRRDNCALVRSVVETCLQKILVERSVAGAVEYVKSTISDLLQNKLDISLLVITKALGKSADSEAYVAKQAHVELAERMRKRDAGSAPAVGDRVPYVIIQAAKGTPAYEKSEDPIYVLENNIPIDNHYYLDNQLSKPLLRIFGPIMEHPESLLHGDHTLSVYIPTPSSAKGMMAFTQKAFRCMACKAVIHGEDTTLCSYCKSKEGEVYVKNLAKVTVLEQRFNRLWSQCQRCQGSLHQDVLCTSRDCPIFYMRKKVQKDLKDATAELDRFSKGSLSW